MTTGWKRKVVLSVAISAVMAICGTVSVIAAESIKVGLVAALSGPSAQSGEAITRGLQLAIDEINAKGGLLGGRMLELVQRDDESSPPKGLIAARELISGNAVAIFGGLDSPVSLAMVPVLNKEKHIYMGVWAAATGITHNGANPNYAFRVSAVDDLVDVRAAKIRASEIWLEEGRPDAYQQSLGPIEREGTRCCRQSRSVDQDRGIEKYETTTSTW